MPTKGAAAKSSEIVFDGQLTPFTISSGLIPLEAALAASAHFVCPCDGTIVETGYRLLEVPGTAAATIFAGITSDTNKFLEDASIGTADALEQVRVTPANTDVSAGDVIVFGTNGNATSTGEAVAYVIIAPTGVSG